MFWYVGSTVTVGPLGNIVLHCWLLDQTGDLGYTGYIGAGTFGLVYKAVVLRGVFMPHWDDHPCHHVLKQTKYREGKLLRLPLSGLVFAIH